MGSLDYYVGWHAHQLHFMLRVYVKNDRQMYVDQYLSSLRPEIADAMQIVAEELFPPGVAQLVKQSVREKWIYGS